MNKLRKVLATALTVILLVSLMAGSVSAASSSGGCNNSTYNVQRLLELLKCNKALSSRINSLFANCGVDIQKYFACNPGQTPAVPGNSGGTQTTTNGGGTSTTPSQTKAPDTTIDNLSFEEQVAALVNKERAANGLSALTLNAKLSDIARAKSQDMHDKKYFSHTSPTYGSPFDMLRSFGISYRAAGENIAMGYATAQTVMTAWMNSPGHRANILNASYTQIGVGYVADGNYWTQLFLG